MGFLLATSFGRQCPIVPGAIEVSLNWAILLSEPAPPPAGAMSPEHREQLHCSTAKLKDGYDMT